VADWFKKLNKELKTTPDNLIDMMIILGKGTFWRIDSFPPLENQLKNKGTWAYLEQENNNLLLLFLHMVSHMSGGILLDYVNNVSLKSIKFVQQLQ